LAAAVVACSISVEGDWPSNRRYRPAPIKDRIASSVLHSSSLEA